LALQFFTKKLRPHIKMLKRGILETRDYRVFTILPEEGEEIHFESAVNASAAFHGDTVEWDGRKVARILSRAPTGRFLVGTLELTSKARYGMTSRGSLLYRFTPFDAAYPPFFVGCSKRELFHNILVRIEFDSWSQESTCPRGNLIQTFGVAGDIAAEEAALLAHYSPVKWKRGACQGSVVIPGGAATEAPLKAFHIDPPGCKDIDDAITIEVEGGEDYIIHIHIADVASWLQENPWLKETAAAIGETLYCDGKVVNPMFPLELSENAFSLLPGEVRRVLTCSFKWKRGSGLLGEPWWSSRTICVTESYTYESAQNAPWASVLTEISGSSDSHKWIEHLMLFYNKEAAKLLRRHGKGVLRRHAAPKEELLQLCKEIGLPAEKMAMASGEYCLSSEDEVRHWGIGTELYCHASSPIRRWADCLNQLCLMGILERGYAAAVVERTHIAALQRLSKRAKSYERELVFLRLLLAPKTAPFLKGTVVKDGFVWIQEWDRAIKVDTKECASGTVVRVFYFCNPSERNWKRRIVFRVDSA